jgi:SAM-dependent methyltransferase
MSPPNGPAALVNSRSAGPSPAQATYADVAEMLAPGPEDDLLEIGCGPGAFLAGFAKPARTVTGLDASRTMLREAEKHLADRITTGTARLVLAGSDTLPFDDGEFSAVTVITAPLNLAEVHRVLRTGGRLVVVDELPADPRRSSPERTGGLWPPNEADTVHLIERAGFTDPTVRYRGVWHLVDNRIIGCTKPS